MERDAVLLVIRELGSLAGRWTELQATFLNLAKNLANYQPGGASPATRILDNEAGN